MLEDGAAHIVVLDSLEKIQSKGQREAYTKRLRALSARRDVWLILIPRCRSCLYQGKVPEVLKWMEEAPDENGDFCTLERLRYLTKIRCYIQFGKYDKAYGLLQKMTYLTDVHKRTYVAMESKLLLAVVQYRIGEKGWRAMLQEAVTQAEEYHFVRLFSKEGGA